MRKYYDEMAQELRQLLRIEIREEYKVETAKMHEEIAQMRQQMREQLPELESPMMRKSGYGTVACVELDDIHMPTPCYLVLFCIVTKIAFANGMVYAIEDGLCHSIPVKEDHTRYREKMNRTPLIWQHRREGRRGKPKAKNLR